MPSTTAGLVSCPSASTALTLGGGSIGNGATFVGTSCSSSGLYFLIVAIILKYQYYFREFSHFDCIPLQRPIPPKWHLNKRNALLFKLLLFDFISFLISLVLNYFCTRISIKILCKRISAVIRMEVMMQILVLESKLHFRKVSIHFQGFSRISNYTQISYICFNLITIKESAENSDHQSLRRVFTSLGHKFIMIPRMRRMSCTSNSFNRLVSLSSKDNKKEAERLLILPQENIAFINKLKLNLLII